MLQFDRKVSLPTGDFQYGKRYAVPWQIPHDVAARLVAAQDAHFVDESRPSQPAARPAPRHPFVVIANEISKEPPASISNDLLAAHNLEPRVADTPPRVTEAPHVTTDAPPGGTEGNDTATPRGTGPDAPPDGPDAPPAERTTTELHCSAEGCAFGVGGRSFKSEAALKGHRTKTHH
jgi:hypothetical protein